MREGDFERLRRLRHLGRLHGSASHVLLLVVSAAGSHVLIDHQRPVILAQEWDRRCRRRCGIDELPSDSCASVNRVIGAPPGVQGLPLAIFSLLAGIGLYRTYTWRPSSRLQVVVDVGALPIARSARALHNIDMSTALQTIGAHMGWKASAQKCSAGRPFRGRTLLAARDSPGRECRWSWAFGDVFPKGSGCYRQ